MCIHRSTWVFFVLYSFMFLRVVFGVVVCPSFACFVISVVYFLYLFWGWLCVLHTLMGCSRDRHVYTPRYLAKSDLWC